MERFLEIQEGVKAFRKVYEGKQVSDGFARVQKVLVVFRRVQKVWEGERGFRRV